MKRIIMKKRIRTILQYWLAHCTAVWVVINMFTVIPYLVIVNTSGDYLFYEDKTPVSIWDYFSQNNFSYDMLMVLFFLLLVEINYNFSFTRVRWYLFLEISLLISIIPFTMLQLHHENARRIIENMSVLRPILLMTVYAFLYALIRDYFYQLKYKKEMQQQQAEFELNTLKSQLNPHFLFNSLNYLYGTALKEGAPQTANGIDQLSDLLRYTITGMHSDFVPLEEEVVFINNYLSLQKERLPAKEHIVIDVHLNVNEKGWKIAPLLLLTFIENAFKYGISMSESSAIKIDLEVINGRLNLKVVNTIISGHYHIEGNNTGIKSTLRRIKLLYPDKHKFENFTDGTVYKISLQLLLNK